MLDWERTWRRSGIVAAVLFVVAYAVSGSQPKVGASADKLVSFYAATAREFSLRRSSSASRC